MYSGHLLHMRQALRYTSIHVSIHVSIHASIHVSIAMPFDAFPPLFFFLFAFLSVKHQVDRHTDAPLPIVLGLPAHRLRRCTTCTTCISCITWSISCVLPCSSPLFCSLSLASLFPYTRIHAQTCLPPFPHAHTDINKTRHRGLRGGSCRVGKSWHTAASCLPPLH